jgi:LuxR family transcriptional regulator, maltose regulon positive regulatory protein
MIELLLETKFRVPRLPVQHVPRAHLVALLERSSASVLTLVSAPAGSGKTTLLAEWARTTPISVAWLSLERADSEPARFVAYLLAALRTLDERIGCEAETLLEAGALANLEDVLSSLLNDLTRLLSVETALVLDDYHELENEAAHTLLTFFLEHLPDQLRLVLGTRVDPPLPLARLRARGHLCEIHAETLRFVPAEVKSFLHAMELELGENAFNSLEQRTEGWIAGVQLAALALRGRTDPETFLQGFQGNHRYILEYVSEEILAHQPPRVRTFLLRTSVLERLNGSLCDAVTGENDGQAVLEELRRANLFVSALDDVGEWYRYHALFAESLRHQLTRHEPALYPQLCARASAWYEQHAMMYEACEYALRAGDFTRAVPLLERQVSRLIGHVEFSLLGRWLALVPLDIIDSRPLLQVAHLWVSLVDDNREPGQVERMVMQLHQHFHEHAPDPEQDDQVEAQANLNFLLIMQALGQRNAEGAIELAEQTLQMLPADATYMRNLASLCITLGRGTAQRLNGDFASAERILSEAGQLTHTKDFHFLNLIGMVSLIEMYEVRGELHKIAQLYQRLLQTLRFHQWGPLELTTWLCTGYARLLLEWNRLGDAENYIQQALTLEKKFLVREISLYCHFIQLDILQAKGDYQAAEKLLQAIEKSLESLQAPHPSREFVEMAAVRRLRFLLRQGKVDEAILCSKQSDLWATSPPETLPQKVEIEEYMALSWQREADAPQEPDMAFYKSMSLVRLRIAQGRAYPAEVSLASMLALLDDFQTTYERLNFNGRVIEILILKSQALQIQGETREALATLKRAVELAEPAGFIRLFANEGEPMMRLLTRLPVQKSSIATYVRSLLAAIPASDGPARENELQQLLPPIHGALAEPLSSREKEVLDLLASGASNQEIAAQLIIAPNTAKRHVKNILGKLDARNRTQAVARARELGLLNTC